jgi:hypothetical protein
MSTRLSTSDLCSSCLAIRPRMNDGSTPTSIRDFIESVGYKKPEGPVFMNYDIQYYLEHNGGCASCISKVKSARE